MTQAPSQARHYWQRHTDGDGRWRSAAGGPPGADLAALRRGAGRECGTVAQMWPFYTTLTARGAITAQLHAEHIALVLFATHQQSRPDPAHRTDIGLGRAIRELADSDRFSRDAVDRRFSAAATATSLTELAAHLRGLINQLRTLRPGPGLDYTRLYRDLCNWQFPDRAPGIRRRWGADYFLRPATEQQSDATITHA